MTRVSFFFLPICDIDNVMVDFLVLYKINCINLVKMIKLLFLTTNRIQWPLMNNNGILCGLFRHNWFLDDFLKTRSLCFMRITDNRWRWCCINIFWTLSLLLYLNLKTCSSYSWYQLNKSIYYSNSNGPKNWFSSTSIIYVYNFIHLHQMTCCL